MNKINPVNIISFNQYVLDESPSLTGKYKALIEHELSKMYNLQACFPVKVTKVQPDRTRYPKSRYYPSSYNPSICRHVISMSMEDLRHVKSDDQSLTEAVRQVDRMIQSVFRH